MSAVLFLLYITIAGAVCVTMLLATWRSHRSQQRLAITSGSLVAELIWAMIPWLMMLAAVAPTALESLRHPSAAAVNSNARIGPRE
jgi:heme/copper-type cytochrome/quinol oxidase subunit 2